MGGAKIQITDIFPGGPIAFISFTNLLLTWSVPLAKFSG